MGASLPSSRALNRDSVTKRVSVHLNYHLSWFAGVDLHVPAVPEGGPFLTKGCKT